MTMRFSLRRNVAARRGAAVAIWLTMMVPAAGGSDGGQTFEAEHGCVALANAVTTQAAGAEQLELNQPLWN